MFIILYGSEGVPQIMLRLASFHNIYILLWIKNLII
jgi:hypothetical protein